MDTVKLPKDSGKRFNDLGNEKIFHHTCQIFKKGGTYGYSPWGTGVLVSIENDYYIFTAAHVTECIDDNTFLYLSTSKGILPISGELNETDYKNDINVDVAYVLLEKEFVEILKNTFTFLPNNKIGIHHKPEITTQYYTLGFPEENIIVNKEKHQVRTSSVSFLHKLMKDKVYSKYNYDQSLHYIVDYAGKGYDMVTNDKKAIIRRPFGMSGSGLWFISFVGDESSFTLDYFLIGIMTEFREKPYDSLIGTKVDVIMDCINCL